MRGERRLDLAQLDAEATDLHLEIDTPEEHQGSIGEPASAVACAVHPRSGLTRKGIREEALRGEIRPPEVAARNTASTDVHFAGDARRLGPPPRIEHVDPAVGQRAPERHNHRPRFATAPFDSVGENADRGLGRAVVIQDPRRRSELLQTTNELPARPFTPEDEELPRDHPLRVRPGEERREVRRDDLETVNLFTLEVSAELVGIGRQLRSENMERAAEAERRKEHGVAEICREGGDVGVARSRRQREPLRHAAHVVDELPMLDGDALGLPRRARGEEHVNEALRAGAGRRARVALPFDRSRIGVEANANDAVREVLGRALLRHHDPGSGLLQDLREAGRRVRRIERNVRAAGLEDTEQSLDHPRRPTEAEADHRVRPDAELAKVIGNPVRPPLQRGVREARCTGHERERVRRAVHLLLEETVNRRCGRVTHPGVVPLHQHPAKLLLGKQREISNAGTRRLHRTFEQGDEMGDQTLDRRRLEELGAIVERATQALRALVHDQHEIRLHGRVVERDRREAEIGERERPARRVLKVEDHLEQRRAAGITLGIEPLHQPLEGRVLVRIGPEANLAHPRNQVPERQLRGDLHPEHQGVDEEPEQRLGLGPRAIGNR